MNEQQQREARIAREVQEVVDRRYPSVLKAHEGLDIDRNTLARFYNAGKAPKKVELVERFARGLGLDVNYWRELCGFPALPSTETDPHREAEAILGAGILALQEKYDAPYLTVRRWKGRDRLTPDEARILLQEVEEDLLREQGEESAARRRHED